MAIKDVTLVVRSGPQVNVATAVVQENEIAITKDTRALYVGDENGKLVPAGFEIELAIGNIKKD